MATIQLPGTLTMLPPLSLYIHIPWCVRKCPYCDFNSHEARAGIPEQDYVNALIADLEQALPLIWGRRVHSIFFGGGTPSIFSPQAIDNILSAVRARVPLAYEAEVTLEANPGTVDEARFAGFRDAGINRLSLGIQSFNSRHLAALGRIHDESQARSAAEIALKTFERVNLDLMYALPEQSMEEALSDVRIACDLVPTHLSCYHLTLEPNTPFYRTPPSLPDDDTSAAMQEAIEVELAQHGFQHYETSAFAQPGKQCRHNLNYWLFGDYLGIGAGAHSKLSFHDRIIRQSRYKHPASYLQKTLAGEHIEREQVLKPADLNFEFMMNALRLTEGFDATLFQERTGLPLSAVDQALSEAEAKGLISRDLVKIAPTLQGQRFLNELLQLFLS
ncbi:MAG: radical SAM family heme chaperone HemW [Methylophilaceae bacterium]|jgi:putative oxygen-independent coproporphyrinogen III oxidase|nr:radical SAM family heme chaperone HemW [Methylophilaceae bacterium]